MIGIKVNLIIKCSNLVQFKLVNNYNIHRYNPRFHVGNNGFVCLGQQICNWLYWVLLKWQLIQEIFNNRSLISCYKTDSILVFIWMRVIKTCSHYRNAGIPLNVFSYVMYLMNWWFVNKWCLTLNEIFLIFCFLHNLCK